MSWRIGSWGAVFWGLPLAGWGIGVIVSRTSACAGTGLLPFRRAALGQPSFVPALRTAAAALLASVLLFSSEAQAARKIIVIRDDKGGSVTERMKIIESYRRTGTKVELRGSYCLSSCTLFLSLQRACVARGTTFGFHGPSSRLYGVALSPEDFERWSRQMARYYPQPLKGWFMKTARQRLVGFYTLSGADLVAMGFRPCTPGPGKSAQP